MKAPYFRLVGRISAITAELRRRANQADTHALAGLSLLLALASHYR